MQTSIPSLAAIVLASFVAVSDAEAQRRGGGGGGARAAPQASSARADVRSTDVRSTSVNNINGNAHVECRSTECGGWDHPLAAAAVVGGAIARIGTVVAYPPPECVPVNVGGVVYQQCGSTWYAPYEGQWVVVNPPY